MLVRSLELVEGELDVEAEFVPRPGYAEGEPTLTSVPGGLIARGSPDTVVLSCPPPDVLAGGRARWALSCRVGERVVFALQHAAAGRPEPAPWTAREGSRRLGDTLAGWQSWSDLHQRYEGPWRELVHSSGRVLQGLTYAPTGAVIAAPTTSLPETEGGSRNWDYRYSWLRVSALTLRAQWVSACPDEALRYLRWMVGTSERDPRGRDGGLQVLYGVDGETDLTERELSHLAGWRGSRPVRLGNGAATQKQIDVAGELLDAVHQLAGELVDSGPAVDGGDRFDGAAARFLVAVADEAARRWRETDSSIWEVRSEERHYLYSKLMCWVALDRALGLADRLGAAAAPSRLGHWRRQRGEIAEAILRDGWDDSAGAYTQSFGSPALDASALMLVLTGLLPPGDPRMRATVEVLADRLSAPCGLLYRYREADGLAGRESPFVLCTYWLVECLALDGQLDRAVALFERVTAYANDVGLLAEEADPFTGEQMGNFPQALSHVGLVNAAWAIAALQRARPARLVRAG